MNDKNTIVETSDKAEFYFKLNDNLKNAVLPVDPSEIEATYGIRPLIDLYQISFEDKVNWLKTRFTKSKMTYIVHLDAYEAEAKRAFFNKSSKDLADDEQSSLTKAVSAAVQTQQKAKQDSDGDQTATTQKIELIWNDDIVLDENAFEDICQHSFTTLVNGPWRSAIEYKVTDQRISKMVYDSLVRPFKQDGTQCKDGEFVVIDKPFRACFYNSGKTLPLTMTQIWNRAIDPIAWFGKPLERKPDDLESYDLQDVSLDDLPSLMRETMN